ncbi:hypothetical protein [Aurantiacibacter gilvus]|uniref:Uncharacterized protein n=1 Tax=Aurantiacibacter gilvus TaxID=3139141 RepID=A0ABU9IBZ7_9SPHN
MAFSVAGCDMLPGAGIDYGDDSSTWANDGECDDPRFENAPGSDGRGMAAVLLEQDSGHDASDCQMLVESGSIQPK